MGAPDACLEGSGSGPGAEVELGHGRVAVHHVGALAAGVAAADLAAVRRVDRRCRLLVGEVVGAVAPVLVVRPRLARLDDVDTEVRQEERRRRAERIGEPLSLLGALDPEVGEVLLVAAEDLEHVGGVLARVEDVGVPHLVDQPRHDDVGDALVDRPELQEHPVLLDGDVRLVVRHLGRRAVLVGDERPLDRGEVERVDLGEGLLGLRVEIAELDDGQCGGGHGVTLPGAWCLLV